MARTTIQQAFDLAVQHHAAGRLREAEQIYRQILGQQPGHAGAMHHLGVIAHQAGRNDDAVDLIRRAIGLGANSTQAHINLGNALQGQGRLGDAIAAFRQAIALGPKNAQAYFNLGNVLRQKGELDQAIAAFQQALTLSPSWPEACNNLGSALQARGHLDDAIAAFRKGIALRPDLAAAHNNLGNVLKDKGRLDEAIAGFRQAIALRPDLPEGFNNLGNTLREKGRLDEAIAALRQAVALSPNIPEAHNNLANALKDKGEFDQAIAIYRRAIDLNPGFAQAYANLGIALKNSGQLDEAIAAYQRALARNPDLAETYTNLGHALKDNGRLDDATAAFRSALALRPDDAGTHSSLILALHIHPAYDGKAIAQELRCFDRQHAQPLAKFVKPHSNERNPDRRLRIGYVSPDFVNQVVGRNLLPLFQQHDHGQFDITCYAYVPHVDAMTREFQRHTDRWRDITDLSDEQAAEQIREDRIDLLVNLTLHTANNRLLIFARKPAPVQVTWLGYPGSTGLSAIDYRLTDPYLDPPGEGDSDYTEESIRLPHSFVCYDEAAMTYGFETIPQVAPLPALANHYVTFGSLNDFCKINEPLLKMWAGVLHAVSGSRLLLLASDGSHRARTRDWFAHNGIDSERIEFVQRAPRRQYLEYYNRIDIGLDTLPYGGYTTSLDSYWMGVPVITLAGKTVVGRAGVSHVMNLGLSEMLARTPEQFVEAAWKLASDVPRLSELRAHLRQRLARSPLSDAPRFARDIEGAYRELWRRWCAKPGSSSL